MAKRKVTVLLDDAEIPAFMASLLQHTKEVIFRIALYDDEEADEQQETFGADPEAAPQPAPVRAPAPSAQSDADGAPPRTFGGKFAPKGLTDALAAYVAPRPGPFTIDELRAALANAGFEVSRPSNTIKNLIGRGSLVRIDDRLYAKPTRPDLDLAAAPTPDYIVPPPPAVPEKTIIALFREVLAAKRIGEEITTGELKDAMRAAGRNPGSAGKSILQLLATREIERVDLSVYRVLRHGLRPMPDDAQQELPMVEGLS